MVGFCLRWRYAFHYRADESASLFKMGVLGLRITELYSPCRPRANANNESALLKCFSGCRLLWCFIRFDSPAGKEHALRRAHQRKLAVVVAKKNVGAGPERVADRFTAFSKDRSFLPILHE